MRSITRGLAVALIIAGTWASTAHAANGDCRLIRGADTPTNPADDVSVCRQDTWIHQATAKPGNLSATGQDAYPSWNTTAPAASYQAGAGGGWLTNSIFHQGTAPWDPTGTAIFEGKYTGTLDDLAVTLYGFVTPAYTGDLDIQLVVDGTEIYANSQVAVKSASAGQPGLDTMKFAFTNLYDYLTANALPTGDATTVHTVRVSVVGTYIVNDPILFVYDAAEVPAGIAFNQEPANLTGFSLIDLSQTG